MAIKKNLTAMALALSLSLNACAAGNAEQKPKQPEYVEATVLSELEIPTDGRDFMYAIRFKVGNNIYSAEVIQASSDYERSKLALDMAITSGTKIKIKKSVLENFQKDGIGRLLTRDIYLEDSN
jgi:hypothetical protein